METESEEERRQKVAKRVPPCDGVCRCWETFQEVNGDYRLRCEYLGTTKLLKKPSPSRNGLYPVSPSGTNHRPWYYKLVHGAR